MDRRNFIKNTALLSSGIALSGIPISNVFAADKTSDDYLIKAKKVKYNTDWDVIIIGGGPSGCAAAISAAREGARTLLIEAMGALGGMGTLGMIPAWCPFSDGTKMISRGIAEKVLIESKKGTPQISTSQMDWVPINAEYLKRVYDRLVKEVGVKTMFFTRVADVVKKSNDEVDAIIVSNKEGLTAFKAKVYVDCTGDGDIAAWAGASFEKGDEKGELQSATLCFSVGNVDTYNYQNSFKRSYNEMKTSLDKVVKSGKYPLLTETHFNNSLISPSIVQFNAGHINDVDGTKTDDLSNGMVQGRLIAEQVVQALNENFPETFGASTIINTASLVGIRESRRILGDYVFTYDDWANRKSFEDEIGRNCYYLDSHKKGTSFPKYKKGESHGIPYRVLTPRGFKNLLVAGRCISTDSVAYASLRVMPNCLVTGEAAGMAAAHSIKMGKPDVHGIDVNNLRKRLKEEGQYFL